MNAFTKSALGAAALLALAASAQAGVISTYDIANARLSGFGGWDHTYTGIIGPGNPTSYTGGTGTLNDGILGNEYTANQLFWTADGPAITLFLDSMMNVSSIELLGGVAPGNLIPGTLTGWSVTIDGNTVALVSTAFGGNCGSGLCDDSVSLIGTGLENLATNKVILSNFQGGWRGPGEYMSISEINVNGRPAQVPEPGTYALIALGLAGVGAFNRRRRAA